MKVLFWGIGIAADCLEERLKSNCELIGYVDDRANISVYKGKRFYTPEQINDLLFDYIVITSDRAKAALSIAETLESRYKIPKEKILPYYVYARHELYYILLNNDDQNEYECMVFGNSHARDGILPKYCIFKTINFSVSSQDIYGNYKTFQRVISEYGYKFPDLKYVVIDLFDYNYLNLDTSLSSLFFDYIASNGLIDRHNFEYNQNFKNLDEVKIESFEEQLKEKTGLICSPVMTEILESIFIKNEGKTAEINEKKYDNRNCIKRMEPLLVNRLSGSLVQKRFENTVKENKKLLEEFIQAIQGFNPKTKIILTLIPKYITMEQVGNLYRIEWKKELYEFISELKNKYHVFFFDMKAEEKISSNNNFYWDICHLNTLGGICMTSILNEYIQKIEMNEENT